MRFRFEVVFILTLFIFTSAVANTKVSQENFKYMFELENEKVEILRCSVKRLNVGTSTEKVKKNLGEPTEERELFTKKGEFLFKLLRYYTKRVDIDAVNTHDEFISLYFDKSGLLIKFTSHPLEILEKNCSE